MIKPKVPIMFILKKTNIRIVFNCEKNFFIFISKKLTVKLSQVPCILYNFTGKCFESNSLIGKEVKFNRKYEDFNFLRLYIP